LAKPIIGKRKETEYDSVPGGTLAPAPLAKKKRKNFTTPGAEGEKKDSSERGLMKRGGKNKGFLPRALDTVAGGLFRPRKKKKTQRSPMNGGVGRKQKPLFPV